MTKISPSARDTLTYRPWNEEKPKEINKNSIQKPDQNFNRYINKTFYELQHFIILLHVFALSMLFGSSKRRK